jgi:SAM-dependent methyltransferase
VKFEDYSRRHRHFHSDWLPPLLSEVARPGVVADIGSGDGAILFALHSHGSLGERTYAIDPSPDRVRAAELAAPGVAGLVGDARQLPLDDESVDGVICSQVIEHVSESDVLVAEIARILRPGGWWYVGSVLRRKHAWWIYRHDGRWWLDPTHVREYGSEEEFCEVLEHPLLRRERVTTSRFRFPLIELALRAGIAARLLRPRAYRVRRRGFAITPPGYRMIEVTGSRREAGTDALGVIGT